MFDFRNATSPSDLHARAALELHENPDAEYNADYQVDAARMVSDLVPTKNRIALSRDDWLERIVSYFASVEVEGRDLQDPLLMVVRHEAAYDLNAQHPVPPIMDHCARCQTWDVSNFKRGTGAPDEKLAVGRVRFARGARVIEVLLCAPCIVRLDVAMS